MCSFWSNRARNTDICLNLTLGEETNCKVPHSSVNIVASVVQSQLILDGRSIEDLTTFMVMFKRTFIFHEIIVPAILILVDNEESAWDIYEILKNTRFHKKSFNFFFLSLNRTTDLLIFIFGFYFYNKG